MRGIAEQSRPHETQTLLMAGRPVGAGVWSIVRRFHAGAVIA